jgi:large subunit ribosomal protein L29
MAKLELKDLDVQALNQKLEETENTYHTMKYNNAVSSLENTSELKLVRRDIARIKTEIRARELAESTQKRDKIQARRRRK